MKVNNHPFYPSDAEVKVYTIPFGYDINNLDNSIAKYINTRTKYFFENYIEEITNYSKITEFNSVKLWMESLLKLKCELIVLNASPIPGFSKGEVYVSFRESNSEEVALDFLVDYNSDDSTHIALSFDSCLYNPDHYPQELLDILKFSCVHFHGWSGSSNLWGLGESNYAMDYSQFQLEVQAILECRADSLIPFNDLRIIFTDYFGSFICYDSSYNIYWGGMEEGDFFRSDLSLTEVIDSLLGHLKKATVSITEIMRREYL